MNIAFDVKGTLDGFDKSTNRKVLELFKLLHDAGHTMYVWSNSYSYAVDMVKKLGDVYGMDAYATLKYSSFSAQDDNGIIMDLAFEDDESQDYLASKRFVWVSDIPRELEAFEKFAKELVDSLK
jgi:hypothetical protein